MRRWLTGLALTGALALLVSGCARPGGVDGDLVDDWPAVGAPVPFVPAPGTCHAGDFRPVTELEAYQPVGCDTDHRVETIHVGMFGGAPADRSAPPAAGTADLRGAYAECDAKARQFLGADWRTGRLWLGVSTPSKPAWAGGARWYRCDLLETATVENPGRTVNRRSSLRDTLADADSPLRLGCFAVTLARTGTVEKMPGIGCSDPHNSEFVGVWTAPSSVRYPERDRDWLPIYDGCYQRVAAYAGVSNDRNLRARSGVVTVPASPEDWRAGDRGVRCYLWVEGGRFTRSLKGVGPSGLPVQTG